MKEQDIRMALASKLKKFRKRSGLTAKEVGAIIGKSDKTVSGWEHGRGQPDADMLFQLCDIYGIDSIAEFYVDLSDDAAMLSADERALIEAYRSLNKDSQLLLLKTAQGFAGSPAMQKENGNTATA